MAQYARALTNRPERRADELDRLQQRADDLRCAIERDVHELESRVRRACDPRLQIARHPFVAAAVVLGGVFVATRIVQSVLRRVQTPEPGEPRRRRVPQSRAVAYSPAEPGPISFEIKERKTGSVPVCVGVASLLAGGVLLFVAAKK